MFFFNMYVYKYQKKCGYDSVRYVFNCDLLIIAIFNVIAVCQWWDGIDYVLRVISLPKEAIFGILKIICSI